MGINSTNVAYNFCQLGSVFTDTADPIQPPTGKVFVAIHFLETTNLEEHGGLVAEQDSANGVEFMSTETAADVAQTAHDIAHDSAPTAISGSGGTVFDHNNQLPAGTVIYGRWTQVHATTNVMIIAYIGE